jgi:predicted ABC-type ATPase
LTGTAKEIFIIGGPNGAGKTTSARVLLRDVLEGVEFLNADEIARRISPDDTDAAAFAAGRELIERMRGLVQQGSSFAFESTLSGKSYLRMIEQCKADGWRVSLFYFWLPSAEYSMERVARRVRQGGHSIPPDVIRRRYSAGVSNMHNLYLPLAEEAEIYDNSDRQRLLIAARREGRPVEVLDHERWAIIEEMAGWNA